MEALRTIDEIRLVRLLRRDERERLFLGTPADASDPTHTELVHLFALPRGADTAAHVERFLAPVRSYAAIGGVGPEAVCDRPTGGRVGLPCILGMGRKEPSSLFLVLEDPAGLPLVRILVESPDWAQQGGRAWLASLCRILSRLHSRDLACGRVLPQHLLVDRRGDAILTEPLTIPVLHGIHGGIPFQDPAFLRLHPAPGSTPPELLVDGGPTPPGDVFQAGIFLHRFLTGRPPYGEGSTLEIFNRVRSGRLEHPIPEVEGVLAGLGAACLAPTPGDRPTAEELADALKANAPETMPSGDMDGSRYSDTFPPLLQLHDGEGTGNATPSEATPPVPTETGREQAMAQLDVMLRQAASSRKPTTRNNLAWLLGLLLVIGLTFFLLEIFGGRTTAPTSRIGPERHGRTHAPSIHGSASLRGGQRSWHLDGIPDSLCDLIEVLGFPIRDIPLETRRAGGDCDVITEGADGLRHRFSFPKCHNLARVCTLDKHGGCAPRPDGTIAFRVLYDPDGRPHLLQALGPKEDVLRNIEIP